MDKYIHRFYRSFGDHSHLVYYHVVSSESDLWIGIDTPSADESIPRTALKLTEEARAEVLRAIAEKPEFLTSLTPLDPHPSFPPAMVHAARKAGTGPMAAVAGFVADTVNDGLRRFYSPGKILVENGGDISAWAKDEVRIGIFAGTSPLSGRLGVTVSCRGQRRGICTSSGTVGHSFSSGKADAAVIICESAALADAHATAAANRIRSRSDLTVVIDDLKTDADILGSILIMGDDIAAAGEYPLYIRREKP